MVVAAAAAGKTAASWDAKTAFSFVIIPGNRVHEESQKDRLFYIQFNYKDKESRLCFFVFCFTFKLFLKAGRI